MGSSLAIVSFGRKNLSRFKEGGREGGEIVRFERDRGKENAIERWARDGW